METVVQYNQLSDVTPEHKLIAESASGQPIEELDIDDVNSFLNGLYLFHGAAEEEFWKSLS